MSHVLMHRGGENKSNQHIFNAKYRTQQQRKYLAIPQEGLWKLHTKFWKQGSDHIIFGTRFLL